MALAGLESAEASNASDSAGFAQFAPSIALGLQRFQPSYNLTLLGPKMRERMAIAQMAQTCEAALGGLTLDLDLEDIVSLPDAINDLPLLQNWQNKTAPSAGHATGPILVLQGLNDTSIFPSTTEAAVQKACSGGNKVHLSLNPGLEHSPLLPASAPEWLAWMDGRFSGHKLTANCSTVTRAPFAGAAYMKLPTESD